jgi:hypothetical protein
MTLAPRAAAIRGDDYQHVVGLYEACCALSDPEIESVSVEDGAGGAFDDVVVRMRPASGSPHSYIQVKSSNYNNQVVDESWLLKVPTRNGRSPLQHFYGTWRELMARGTPFDLTLLSNRNFDHNDPLLSQIDKKTNRIPRAVLDTATPRSNVGKATKRWAQHLGIDAEALKTFIANVNLVHGEADSSWEERCRPLMKTAGMRDDDDAVKVARAMVRDWVTLGAGPQSRDDIRTAFTSNNLLAREGTLVLAVHAIDRIPPAQPPNVTVDFVELYPDNAPSQRRQLSDPSAWQDRVVPGLIAARDDLCAFRTRRVHIVGSMRLPVYFAVGRTLPDVGGWVLSVDQRGQEWATNAEREEAILSVLADEDLGTTGGLVVVLALTNDPSEEVRTYLHHGGPPAKRLVVLSALGGPSQTAVKGAGWAAEWVSRAREFIRDAARTATDGHVHLFLACPAAVAMLAGHQWNLVPTTTVYEHQNPGYEPTMTFPG